jgi:hypothetical protein
MGYYVRSLPQRLKGPKWKLQYVSYKYADIKHSAARKPKKEWDVPRPRYRSLGFHDGMTIDDARVRARQLNTQLLIKRQEEKIKAIADAECKRRNRVQAVLPTEFVEEFELRFIRACDRHQDSSQRIKRATTIWRAAQHMVAGIGIEASDWFLFQHEIYDYFATKQYSVRYVHAILRFANLWGFYICKKLAKPFLPIPIPRGFERQRLISSYYEKANKVRRPSKPLDPAMLSRVVTRINRPNYNWLHLSVWFGLRPKEIDSLHDKKMWFVEVLGNGRAVLWVFQTKIIALPPEDRWKPIPILYPEQERALEILKKGNFKRPLTKTMRLHFGPGVDAYAGRKGFADLMLSRGQSFENISIWMWHSTISRTWRSYKNRGKFHLGDFDGSYRRTG